MHFVRDPLSKTLLAAAIVLMAAALVLSLLAFLHRPEGQWDPLGAYPQSVPTKPMFHLNEAVTLTGQKCSKVDGVTTHITRTWVPANISGIAVQDENGVGRTRYRSCGPSPTEHLYRYRDVIPAAVAAIVREDPIHARVWVISGTDIPYDKSGRVGAARTYTSQQFELVP